MTLHAAFMQDSHRRGRAGWPGLWLAPCLALGLLCAAPAQAATGFGVAVGDSALDAVRGGFSVQAGGLAIAFGVQRVVHVDGRLAGAAAATGAAPAAATLLVQSGGGNSYAGALQAASAAVVVQNTLNGRAIEAVTVIDVSANSLQVYRGANLQSVVGTAVTASLRR